MKKPYLSLALAVLTLCAPVANVWGRSTLANYFEASASFVPNDLTLSIMQEFSYNDNVNDAPSGARQGAFSSDTSLSCSLLREFKNGIVYGLEGEVSYEWYDDKEVNEDSGLEWSINPKLRGDFNLLDSDSLELSLRSESHIEAFDSTDSTRTRYQTFGGSLVYDYTGGRRLGLALVGDYEYTHYLDSDYRDRSNHEYELSFAPYYKLTENTKVGLRAAFGQTIYRNNRLQDDSETVTVNAFVDYRFNHTISAHAELGGERVSYSGTASDNDESGEWSPDAALSLSYSPASNVTFTYSTSYGLEDTKASSRGGRRAWENSLNMAWNLTAKVTLNQSLSYKLTDEKNGNSQDCGELSYNIKANYKFNNRISMHLGYEYQNSRYAYEHDSDNYSNEWSAGVSCSF